LPSAAHAGVTTPILVLLIAFSAAAGVSAEPRVAQNAGQFYPADPAELRATVTRLLEQYPAGDLQAHKPRILISPHAGYEFSGVVAARAFAEVVNRRYDGVVVVGFTHRDQFEGASVDDRESYQTPLGTIPVDREAVSFLLAQPRFQHLERAHAQPEHSLEVMLPFLQVALGEFRLVPVLIGGVDGISASAAADALAALAQRGDYLFVFSSDLSHYHPYDDARTIDDRTVNAILGETSLAVDRLFVLEQLEACGRGPIRIALLLAERLGYPERRLLAKANSGDTTGDKSRVVGYAAIGMYERDEAEAADRISAEAGQALVRAARQAITAHLQAASGRAAAASRHSLVPRAGLAALAPLGSGDGAASVDAPAVALEDYPELARPRGVFVTLRRQARLRGCIGRIEAQTVPLNQAIAAVALDAALRDPRFPPLTAEELDDVTVDVSVLTVPRRIAHPREIVAGRDGVVLRLGPAGGVFLPSVWHETGWTRKEFLNELASQKAGLDPNAWQQAELLTFQAQEFEEAPEPAAVPGSPH